MDFSAGTNRFITTSAQRPEEDARSDSSASRGLALGLSGKRGASHLVTVGGKWPQNTMWWGLVPMYSERGGGGRTWLWEEDRRDSKQMKWQRWSWDSGVRWQTAAGWSPDSGVRWQTDSSRREPGWQARPGCSNILEVSAEEERVRTAEAQRIRRKAPRPVCGSRLQERGQDSAWLQGSEGRRPFWGEWSS